MKSTMWGTTVAVATVFAMSMQAQTPSGLVARMDAAADVVRQIQSVPDGGIPDAIVAKAHCIAVIPSVKKAAFVVGASYGQGVVTCRTGHGWSGPVFIRLAGGSFGFQIGAQATDLVLVAVNDKGFQDLLHSKFKIGADAAAAAGPVGRNASAATDASLSAELLTYSRSKGLFAGVDLNGAVVSQNTSDTKAFYGGGPVSYRRILRGAVPVPRGARRFVSLVARYFAATK